MSFSDAYPTDDATNENAIQAPAAPAVETPKRKTTPRKAAKTKDLSPADVTRVLETYTQVKNMEADERLTLASLAGLDNPDDKKALTVALLTAKMPEMDMAQRVIEWHSGTPIDTTLAIYALSEERAGLSPLWSFMSEQGFISGSQPRRIMDAVRELATAVHSLDASQIGTLASALSVLA